MDLYTPASLRREEHSLLDFFILLAKHKRLIVACQLVTAVVAGVVLWLLPNVYTGTARIMPPQQGQSAASAALGLLAGATGGGVPAIGQALGLKNPNDLYVGILKGDTISDRMIERFNLKRRFGEQTLARTREALADVVSISSGRDGLILIQVDDEDPAAAAAMANAYVEELDRLTQQLAVTEASQRRLFYERELAAARGKLASAEEALRSSQEATGLIEPEGQAKAMFEAFTELAARIAAKEVEIASMRTFATARNPKLRRAQEEAASLRAQLSKLEKLQSDQKTPSVLVPTAQIPQAGVEHLRRLRDLKYQEALFEQLAKQYELAKLDEAKDATLIQVVDRASPPDMKSKPRRGLLLALALLLATLVGAGWAWLREGLEAQRRRPEGASRFAQLRRHLSSWRS